MCPGFESLWAHQFFKAVGYSQAGKATDFDSVMRRFESCYPSHDPLAQAAEHLTFNQGVRSSNLRWVTNNYGCLAQKNSKRIRGEVSERFKELVLKTSDSERGRGFESHPLRHKSI